MQTWSNLADCLVQRASLCCEAGQGQQGGTLFQEAVQVGGGGGAGWAGLGRAGAPHAAVATRLAFGGRKLPVAR